MSGIDTKEHKQFLREEKRLAKEKENQRKKSKKIIKHITLPVLS